MSAPLVLNNPHSAAHGAALTSHAFHDLGQLPADVLALFENSARVDPQLGLAWYQNLVRTVFINATQPTCLHVLRQDGRAVAMLPLRLQKHALGGRAAALGNYYTTLFAPAMADGLKAAELAVLLRDVRHVHAPLRSLTLAPMDPAAPSFELLRQALRIAGWQVFDFFSSGNWYLPVTGNASDYLATRPGALRSTLRRMGKKFAAESGRLEVLSGTDAATRGLAAFNAVYSLSWKQAEPYPLFMPGLAELCAARGWLRLGVAWLGPRPVAAQFWIVANGKAQIYKLAYDDSCGHLSPGSLLTAELMRHAIDIDRVTEVDYLSGDDAYKAVWMSQRRERHGLVAYNPRNLAGLLGAAVEYTVRGLKALSPSLRSRSPSTTVQPP